MRQNRVKIIALVFMVQFVFPGVSRPATYLGKAPLDQYLIAGREF